MVKILGRTINPFPITPHYPSQHHKCVRKQKKLTAQETFPLLPASGQPAFIECLPCARSKTGTEMNQV
jgi:hypothetical protein